jgi:pimeloyl-ACP methyl ester carboxylesterase
VSSSVRKGYADTPFGQVHFREAGRRRPDQLPLVLLHQTASSSVMYERLMAELAPAVWMFAPDTPGFGGTEALAERGSIARYAEVLLAAMRRMEIDRCWLFGHHSGASIAVQIAHDHPEMIERLALSGPPYLTKQQIEKLVPAVCPVELEADGGHVMAVWNRIRAKDPDAPLALSHRETVLNLHAGVRYPEAYDAVFSHDLPGQLAALECPTLVMAGAQDTIVASVEPAFRALRQGEKRIFPVGGTYICDREPGVVADALRSFFDLDGGE